MSLQQGIDRLKQWWRSAVHRDEEKIEIERRNSLSAEDPVDETSMESFPSSDPPSWTPARGVATPERNESRG